MGKSWKELYGWGSKIWGAGYGFLVGKFYGIINLVLLVSTYLMVKGFHLGFIESILLGITAVGVIFVSGILYVRLGLLKAESSSNFVENPQLHEMYLRIQHIDNRLTKMQTIITEDKEDIKKYKEMFL